MTEYINSWKNYVNFTARTTRRGYWMAFLIHFIISIVISMVLRAIFGDFLTIYQHAFTGEFIFDFSTGYYIYMLWTLAYLLPGLAIQIRRLRDAGKHWAYIFIALIPIVGWILYIVALCRRSIEDNGVPVV